YQAPAPAGLRSAMRVSLPTRCPVKASFGRSTTLLRRWSFWPACAGAILPTTCGQEPCATSRPISSNARASIRASSDSKVTSIGVLFPDHPLAFLIVQQIRQIGDRTAKKGDVVKRVMHDCLCYGARLTAVGANHKDAGVVVGHRQTPVILGLRGLGQRDRYRVSRARLETHLRSAVDQHRGRILRKPPQQCRLFHLHDTPERT